jgi:formate dehydrogenase maturation protein FdhE
MRLCDPGYEATVSVFTPKEPLVQRSANLYRRQWERLEDLSGKEHVPVADVLRNIVDLGLQAYDALAAKKAPKRK